MIHKPDKPLIETNPYLRDPKQREKLLAISAASSTAIETGASVRSILRTLKSTEPSRRRFRRKRTA